MTTPLLLTVAMEGLPLLHVPPVADEERVAVLPSQMDVVPEIVPAVMAGVTVMETVSVADPQLL